MGVKLFNKSTRKSCAWCTYGVKSQYSDEIFCKKHGVVGTDDVCRKYSYDPLKRTPDNIVIDKSYSAKDFEL